MRLDEIPEGVFWVTGYHTNGDPVRCVRDTNYTNHRGEQNVLIAFGPGVTANGHPATSNDQRRGDLLRSLGYDITGVHTYRGPHSTWTLAEQPQNPTPMVMQPGFTDTAITQPSDPFVWVTLSGQMLTNTGATGPVRMWPLIDGHYRNVLVAPHDVMPAAHPTRNTNDAIVAAARRVMPEGDLTYWVMGRDRRWADNYTVVAAPDDTVVAAPNQKDTRLPWYTSTSGWFAGELRVVDLDQNQGGIDVYAVGTAEEMARARRGRASELDGRVREALRGHGYSEYEIANMRQTRPSRSAVRLVTPATPTPTTTPEEATVMTHPVTPNDLRVGDWFTWSGRAFWVQVTRIEDDTIYYNQRCYRSSPDRLSNDGEGSIRRRDAVTGFNANPADYPTAVAAAVAAAAPRVPTRQVEPVQSLNQHEQDIATIGRILIDEAESRSWCGEYDQIVRRINREISVPLPTRHATYDIVYTVPAPVEATMHHQYTRPPTPEQIAALLPPGSTVVSVTPRA